jgi:hypothetical protein
LFRVFKEGNPSLKANWSSEMSYIPTKKISDGKGGYIVINESDYNEEQHELYNDEDMKNGQGRGDESTQEDKEKSPAQEVEVRKSKKGNK